MDNKKNILPSLESCARRMTCEGCKYRNSCSFMHSFMVMKQRRLIKASSGINIKDSDFFPKYTNPAYQNDNKEAVI